MTDNNGPPIIDGDVPKMHIVRVHLNDWTAATRGFSLDEEGFYWRFTVLLYDKMGDLADNDAHNARSMSLDIRVYKKMKARLIELGKIYIADGHISNSRVEREISNYLREFKRRSEAAKAREEKKREAEIPPDFQRTSGELQATSSEEVREKSGELPSQLGHDLFEKANKNNECNATAVAEDDQSPRARARPKPKPKPVEERKNPLTPPVGGQSPIDQAFEDFWSAFPPGRKQSKGEARETFRKIITGKHRRGLRAKAETLIDAATRYAASKPDPEYTPKPTTWLNAGSWEDDVCKTGAAAELAWWQDDDKLACVTDAMWRGSISKHANGIWPIDRLGPPPGTRECVVPRHIIDELRLTERYTDAGISREKH